LLDVRSPVILGAAPAGLALACLGWLVLSGGAGVIGPVDELDARLAALPVARATAVVAPAAVGAGGPGVFATTAQTAVVRLDGISRTPRRAAALLAFNGGAAQWVAVGATQDGVTLVEIGRSKIVIETASGRQTITLGESSAPEADTGSASFAPSRQDDLPAGMRQGVPPASAPGAE
jgi:hypothetical protein